MKCIVTLLASLITLPSVAQREVLMTQYMYNKYTVNPAFGGSHNALSIFGSYRKQWVGFDNSPSGAIFTIHSPLKSEKVALGAQFFNENYAASNNTGFNLSYTYRLLFETGSYFSLGFFGGIMSYESNWNDVDLVDPDPTVFGSVEQSTMPWFGFGVALYSDNYFAGFSIPSFMYHDRYITNENSLDFNKLDYLFTGGYLFKLNDIISIQPSALLRINFDDESFVDVSATAILLNSLLIGTSYRTNGEVIGIVGYQVTPQLRFMYSLDYNFNKIGSYSNGTHEVSIQFDFGYKIISPSPKFF